MTRSLEGLVVSEIAMADMSVYVTTFISMARSTFT